ncbi:hypothetical protein A2914_02270 [Candidatus Nomurabacteria bacterium RIFCSPLOWO2_01_FULL_41_21]|uniref:Uncharacterized protein n=2 Tax=Candidatus Nomuraibacteriota TaxID=1752729 RepID=A0A1F6V2L3_9BACT|nr:MAG: hypothetical protein A2733_01660 [Candidatus Nomurabacteria bacterium RIFCSPHIGHO2_01_FULL_40_20]OGI88751.1 MAG: hypothetical protein A2914_02270 [Candidatus Nomurabacteria bacterium RIFCSPLOWO2_01_FULL_41_21]
MNIISDLFHDFFLVKIAYASVDSFIGNVNKFILNPLIVLLFAIAFVVFLYGIVMFLVNQENEQKRTDGKKHMIWGLVGLTIMFCVWALINLLVSTFKLEQDVTPDSSTVGGTVHLQDFPVQSPYVPP